MAAFRFKLVKDKTHIDFVGKHKFTFALSFLMAVTTIVLLFTRGLNLGIDFTGGVLIEVGITPGTHIEDIRTKLENLSTGRPTIQEFGGNAVMIKVPGREADSAAQKTDLCRSAAKTRRGREVPPRGIRGPAGGA